MGLNKASRFNKYFYFKFSSFQVFQIFFYKGKFQQVELYFSSMKVETQKWSKVILQSINYFCSEKFPFKLLSSKFKLSP